MSASSISSTVENMESFGVKTSNQREGIQNCRKHIASEFCTIIHASATRQDGLLRQVSTRETVMARLLAQMLLLPACTPWVSSSSRWHAGREGRSYLADRRTQLSAQEQRAARMRDFRTRKAREYISNLHTCSIKLLVKLPAFFKQS